MTCASNVRHLVVVLGDQLDRDAAIFDGFDAEHDAVWMAEVPEESTHVWSHRARIALFLSAMRHFAEKLRTAGVRVVYQRLEDPAACATLGEALKRSVGSLSPEHVRVTKPGDWRVEQALRDAAVYLDIPLDIVEDRHFLCSTQEFARHAEGRKQLRLEPFYREMRKRHDILMEEGRPVGGSWNFDKENRRPFGRGGPPAGPPPSILP